MNWVPAKNEKNLMMSFRPVVVCEPMAEPGSDGSLIVTVLVAYAPGFTFGDFADFFSRA